MNLFSTKYFFLIIVAIHAIVFAVVKDDPFFGDAIASTSKAALTIHDSGFHTIFYPETVDPGHPTLFPLLMALCWQLGGLSLWVSHLVSIASMLLMLWSLRKCCLLFVPLPQANLIVLLSCCFATTLSMSAMMLNTTLLMSFCLLAVYALLAEQKWLFVFVASWMMLTHLQSAYFLTALFVADCWIGIKLYRQTIAFWIKTSWIKYTVPFLVFMGWLLIHYSHTGWFIHSPNYSDAQSLKGLGTFVKGLVIILWRLVDYGMLPVHCITVVALWRNKVNKKLAVVFCILLLVTSLIMAVTLEHTIGHRYFLVFQLLSIAIAVHYLFQLQKKYLFAGIGLISVSLIAGNFLYYPGKTLGDATLAYRNYFTVEKQLEIDFPTPDTLYSYAPIANPIRSRYLSEKGLTVLRIRTDSLHLYPIVLQSNVNAEFSAEQRKYLEANWYGKSYESGAVYATVFLNPVFYPKQENWLLREPSWIEQQISDLKNKFSN